MKYFEKFGLVEYDTLGNGVKSLMTDFTPNFKVRIANLQSNVSYMKHTIGDGERPDVTSHILYGTSAYHWSFFIINDFLRKGISEWPLSQYELDLYISDKYNKYAAITFDPSNVNTNLSYVPFTAEYIDSLYLAVDMNGGVAYRKIVEYNSASCQMVIERKSPTLNIRDNDTDIQNEYDPINVDISKFIEANSYRISSILFDADGFVVGQNQSFVDAVNASYGQPADSYFYDVAVDINGNHLKYELMKNAAYQFFEYVNEEPVGLTLYDMIKNDMIFPNVNRITYEEMENIQNENRRNILVINPANIKDFAQSYFSALNNV